MSSQGAAHRNKMNFNDISVLCTLASFNRLFIYNYFAALPLFCKNHEIEKYE